MKKIIGMIPFILALMLLSSSLSGCLLIDEDRYAEDGNIRYIAYTCAAPTDEDSFSFTIEEKDGTVGFTAWCGAEDGEKIVLTGVPVDGSELDAVRGIAEKHSLSDFLIAQNTVGTGERKDFLSDETLYTLIVMWDNGESAQSTTAWLAADELRDFFFDLAGRVAGK